MLTSSVLVALALLGRAALQPPAAELRASGMRAISDVDSVLAVAESVYAEGRRRREPLGLRERIDPNLAGEVELDRLPGIGPSLAGAIVRDRLENGPFRALGDLERVPGLGSKIVERLAPHLTLPGSVGGGGPGLGGPAGRPAGGLRVDLNRATLEQLQALPGIGPGRASAILRWRRENGPFRNLEALLEVPGIGPRTVERLRPLAGIGP